MASPYHIGQRLSLKGQTCTVRYTGLVEGKGGDWLGVEWDAVQRGKHNGAHDGKKYFDCRSKYPTCASFLRPNQPWDKPRTFLEALKDKYVSQDEPSGQETIYFSSKQAEEVGFDKFARRQAELKGIHVLVLDRMCIRHREDDVEVGSIERICKEVTELHIGGNLFESLAEIYSLIRHFPQLGSLTLDGNRISNYNLHGMPLSGLSEVRTLNLSNTLLDWRTELMPLLHHVFPGVQAITATNNEYTSVHPWTLPAKLRTIDLSGNSFASLSDIRQGPNVEIGACIGGGSVETLILKNCNVSEIGSEPPHGRIEELDLRRNAISSWSFIDALPMCFPTLSHLRTTGNPLYSHPGISAEGKALTAEDGYMLTIARLPRLQTLNYSKVTEKERLNAETYYLSLIAAEIAKSSSEDEADGVRKRNPRWSELCEEYGEPAIIRQRKKGVMVDGEVDPDSLAARLVNVTFSHDGKTWVEEIPKAFTVYEVLGLVGKKLRILPLKLRLVLETGEQDPLAQGEEYTGPEEWCSDSEDEEGSDGAVSADGQWTSRKVELIAGTRVLGTYIEGREASIVVEKKT